MPKHNRPSIEVLRSLVEFDDSGSVTAAGRKLGLAQSVVTRKLQGFMSTKACGAKLLARNGNALELTEAGRDALPPIRELVRQYDHLMNYLAGLRTEPRLVRLAVGSFVAQHYVPQAIALLRRSETPVEVETQIVRGQDRIVGIVKGSFDLAIVSHAPTMVEEIARTPGGRKTDLCIEPLAKLDMCVVAKKNTPEGADLARLPVKKAVPLNMINRWELVGLDRSSGIRKQLEQHLSNPKELHFLSGGGWSAAKEFVRHGIGVAIIPAATLSADDCKDFVVRPLSDGFSVGYYVVHRSGNQSSGVHFVKEGIKQSVLTESA